MTHGCDGIQAERHRSKFNLSTDPGALVQGLFLDRTR